jgi:hypothetical protein
VTDFQLEYDEIFTASVGYVKDYRILSQKGTGDGLYEVLVEAKVSKGTPGMTDWLAIRQLVHRKGNPKLAIHVDEKYDGLPPAFGEEPKYVNPWFENKTRELQLNLTDISDAGNKFERSVRRDEAFGDTFSARVRNARMDFSGDFILQVKLRGKYVGRESFYGTLPKHRMALMCDLRVVRPDSQKVLISLPLPGTENMDSDKIDIHAAARDMVFRMLEGDPRVKYPGAKGLFRKLFAEWVTELDLGVMMVVELDRVGKRNFDSLVAGLKDINGVTSVFPGTFDRRGFSYLEIESRLGHDQISNHIGRALGDDYVIDRATKHFLQYAYDPETP